MRKIILLLFIGIVINQIVNAQSVQELAEQITGTTFNSEVLRKSSKISGVYTYANYEMKKKIMDSTLVLVSAYDTLGRISKIYHMYNDSANAIDQYTYPTPFSTFKEEITQLGTIFHCYYYNEDSTINRKFTYALNENTGDTAYTTLVKHYMDTILNLIFDSTRTSKKPMHLTGKLKYDLPTKTIILYDENGVDTVSTNNVIYDTKNNSIQCYFQKPECLSKLYLEKFFNSAKQCTREIHYHYNRMNLRTDKDIIYFTYLPDGTIYEIKNTGSSHKDKITRFYYKYY